MTACTQPTTTDCGSMTRVIQLQVNADSLALFIVILESLKTIPYPVVVAVMLTGMRSQPPLKLPSASRAMAPRSGETTSLLHAIQYVRAEHHFPIQQNRILCRSPRRTNTTTSPPTFRMVLLKSYGVSSRVMLRLAGIWFVGINNEHTLVYTGVQNSELVFLTSHQYTTAFKCSIPITNI